MSTNNKLIKQVEAEFKNRTAYSENEKHKAYLFARQNNEFKQADDELKKMTLLLCEFETNSNDKNNSEKKQLESNILAQKQKVSAILKSLNIKMPKINLCPICTGSGILPNGEYCKCFKKRLMELMQKESGLKEESIRLFSDCNLDIFDNKTEIKKIYETFESIIKNFDNIKYKNIFLQGKSGVGKTYLYSAVAGELLSKGISTFYLTSFNFNNLVLKYHTTFDEHKLSYLAPLLEADALIIDDLGTEQIFKNVTVEYLLMILKERNLNNKKTFFNSNLSPSEILDKYGERIFSRIFNKADSLIIQMENSNLRIKK